MKRNIFVFLVVLVLSLLIVGGAAAKGGWQVNPGTTWADGGTFNVVKDGTVILWRDVTVFSLPTVDQYWLADVSAPCPPNYSQGSDIQAGGFDLTPFLGWNDPQWRDGFRICGVTVTY